MRFSHFYVPIMLFSATHLLAQNQPFSFTTAFTNLDASQTKIVNYASGLPHLGSLYYLSWNLTALNDAGGTLSMSLPNLNNGQPVVFTLDACDFAKTSEYALFYHQAQGNLSLYVTPQGIGGTVDYGSRAFSLFPLGGTKGVLIENAPADIDSRSCATTSDGEGTGETGYCNTDCGKSLVDVLALITPAAQAWLDANYGTFGYWFLFAETHNINGAFAKSDIPDKRVRVTFASFVPDFTLEGSYYYDLFYLKQSPVRQALSQQYGADIVIMLTNLGTYDGFGAIPADQQDPKSSDKVGIV